MHFFFVGDILPAEVFIEITETRRRERTVRVDVSIRADSEAHAKAIAAALTADAINKELAKAGLLAATAGTTVRHRGMGTGISEASKRVPIFSFATQGGKQVSSHFRQGN